MPGAVITSYPVVAVGGPAWGMGVPVVIFHIFVTVPVLGPVLNRTMKTDFLSSWRTVEDTASMISCKIYCSQCQDGGGGLLEIFPLKAATWGMGDEVQGLSAKARLGMRGLSGGKDVTCGHSQSLGLLEGLGFFHVDKVPQWGPKALDWVLKGSCFRGLCFCCQTGHLCRICSHFFPPGPAHDFQTWPKGHSVGVRPILFERGRLCRFFIVCEGAKEYLYMALEVDEQICGYKGWGEIVGSCL